MNSSLNSTTTESSNDSLKSPSDSISNSFSSTRLSRNLLESLSSLGYETMTPVQSASLPEILSGKDVIAQGKTGSGKTAAFGLGLLNKLDVKRFRIQTLVLCPTRELADQVANEIRRLARSIHNIKVLTLCGGVPLGPQIGSLEHGAHIIVGTPGRIVDHLQRDYLQLKDVDMLVLDEADRMLEMGFSQALDFIVKYLPKQRQTLLFSATFPDSIMQISKQIMNDPVIVQVKDNEERPQIAQHFHLVADNNERMIALQLLLLKNCPTSTIVFCNTKLEAQNVCDRLSDLGFDVATLHGDLEQKDRDQTLIRFANKSISVLVATDLAARGLDVDNLDMVINYHLAQDSEVHIHRIGRTARAGSKGIAHSFFEHKNHQKIAMLEDYFGKINSEELPDRELLKNQPYKAKMVTLRIEGGKKQKLRAGDILGALTADKQISGSMVGKIQILDNWTYVAIDRNVSKLALDKLINDKLKGKSFRARVL